MTIRPATPADARAIAAVHVASWQDAYRGLVPDDVLDALSVDDRAEQWDEWLRAGETRTLVTQAVDGFVTFWEERGEISALYIAPARTRTGIGTALLDAAHAELAQAGRDETYLWVFEDNAPAREFYARHGYAPDGAEYAHETTGANVIRLHRSLSSHG
jgi:ribosomal protein S18 acetylase RimI-like enzyme